MTFLLVDAYNLVSYDYESSVTHKHLIGRIGCFARMGSTSLVHPSKWLVGSKPRRWFTQALSRPSPRLPCSKPWP